MVFARFLISGLLNTGITYILYLALLQELSYSIAYSCAFVIGVLISYGLNAMFVFRAGMAVGSLLRFSAAYLAQYFLGLTIIASLVEYLNVADWLAPVFAMMVTVPLIFILSRTIFMSRRKRGVGVANQ